jgi:hypothetical protein
MNIIELAQQEAEQYAAKNAAGDWEIGLNYQDLYNKKFAALVEAAARADEREACAKVCDAFQARDVGMQPAECAGAIRARGERA